MRKTCRQISAPPATREGEEFDTAWYKGNLSHYQKFRILLHSHHKLPSVYTEETTEKAGAANSKMKMAFLHFWNLMEISFNTEGGEMPESFWKEMLALGNSLADVWQSGMCPDFHFDTSHTPGHEQ